MTHPEPDEMGPPSRAATVAAFVIALAAGLALAAGAGWLLVTLL